VPLMYNVVYVWVYHNDNHMLKLIYFNSSIHAEYDVANFKF